MTRLRIQFHPTPAQLAETALPYLARHEAENNLVIGLMGRMREDPGFAAGATLLSVHEDEDDRVVGAAVRTAGRGLIMSKMPEAAAPPVAEELAPRIGFLDAVAGPFEPAEAFAKRWAELKGPRFEPLFRQVTMVAEKITSPLKAEGSAAKATTDHLELLMEWCAQFRVDAGLKGDPPMPEERLRAMIGKGDLLLWLAPDGSPRSMAARVRETPNGATIALVYTPMAWRGRGYASQCVAALCEAILAAGKQFVCLFADTANPTSTGLYRRLGFREVAQGVVLRFLDDRTG